MMSASTSTGWPRFLAARGLRMELERRQPQLAAAAQLAAVATLPCLLAMQIDPRLTHDISVWIKPTKFLLSLALYFATLAWFFGYLPQQAQRRRGGRFVIGAAIGAGLLEMLWLIAAATKGVPSHFNRQSLPWALAYSAAGIGAVLLVAAIFVQGVMIARDRTIRLAPVFRSSLVAGAVVAFVGTLLTAGYLSSGNGHWVGGVPSDAAGLPVLGWSRSGGDLRVAHFWALHAHQALPLAGALIAASGIRRAHHALWSVTAAYVALIVFTFLQALAGRPFLA
jgi:hypothetical protein